jgi:hypothetical protein
MESLPKCECFIDIVVIIYDSSRESKFDCFFWAQKNPSSSCYPWIPFRIPAKEQSVMMERLPPV